MFALACFYVDSHVQHDIWMTQRTVDQQNQIDFLLKYVIILKTDNFYWLTNQSIRQLEVLWKK